MPTVDQYAASVVEKYQVVPSVGSGPHRAADEIIPLLKEWGKQYLLGLTLSGAYAKGTAITLSSAVDILIALRPVPGMEIKTIFWNLFTFLTDQNLRPRSRCVSMQVQCQGLAVDLVPVCRDRNSSGDMLFAKKSERTVRTDIARHNHLISNSGRQQEISALKIWRERHELDFPSLYLELTVLHALEAERFGQLADNVINVLHYLASRFEQAVVCDPANPENILSNDLDLRAKQAVAKAARDALYDENWKKILW